MRLLALALLALLALPVGARAQTVGPTKYFSAATTNSTLVLGRKVAVGSVVAYNSTATLYYLKLYNKVTAPVCGTDIPRQTYALPANGGFVLPPGGMMLFGSGLGFCITSGFADNDVGVAATGVIVNFGVSAQ